MINIIIQFTNVLIFPGGSDSKESACNAEDLGSVPVLGRSPGERNGYTLQYSGLENSMDCSLPGSSLHGVLQARILEWISHSLLQGTFPTQGLNPGLPHCRQILSHQGSPLTKRQGKRNKLRCHLLSKLPAPVPAGVGA